MLKDYNYFKISTYYYYYYNDIRREINETGLHEFKSLLLLLYNVPNYMQIIFITLLVCRIIGS